MKKNTNRILFKLNVILGQFIISNLKRCYTLLITKIVNLVFLRAYGSLPNTRGFLPNTRGFLPNTRGFERHFRQYGAAMEPEPNFAAYSIWSSCYHMHAVSQNLIINPPTKMCSFMGGTVPYCTYGKYAH